MSQNPARQAEYEKAGERMKTKTKKQREIRNNATAWALMAPALIFMLAFTVFPIFRSLYLSLSKYKLGMDSAEFIGLENYVKLAGSKLFWKVMKNTIVFALMTVIPSMAVGLGLAVLVNRKGKRVGFIRTAYFYPVVMPMIAIASVWMFIYMAKNGLIRSVPPSTSTLYSSKGSSSSRTDGNLGSWMPALTAFCMISSATFRHTGDMVPMHPRKAPPLWMDTKTPALV